MPNRSGEIGPSKSPHSVSPEGGVEMMIGLLIGGWNLACLRVRKVGEGKGERVWAKSGGRVIVWGRIGRAILGLVLVGRKMARVWENEDVHEGGIWLWGVVLGLLLFLGGGSGTGSGALGWRIVAMEGSNGSYILAVFQIQRSLYA